MPEAELENKRPTEQQNQRMNQSPNPADCGTDEALFEVPADELKQQAAPFHQIMQKERARQSEGHCFSYNTSLFKYLQREIRLDIGSFELVQSPFANL